MGNPVLILGESGCGKSTSMRNINPDDCFVIQPIRKMLPFRNSFKPMSKEGGQIKVTDNTDSIIKIIDGAVKLGKKMIIIDDFQYIMANEFMRRSKEKSYDKFNDIGFNAWSIINHAQSVDSDIRIYFMSHTETDMSGKTKIKTIGKMLDEKITIEGMFTIVLGASVSDGKYTFSTQNSGSNTLKSPMGMFEELNIDNDLQMIDETIVEYYNLEK
ncbi:AAA domain protein [Vibrio phage 2.095.A._10N.286.46.E10]|nr:AAA domain protein [Vibrio phage 1.127.O._10N.286.52.E12]AUS02133.1 AAA domain protein [Vibrio phage 2.095.A._10N.286.46.E10]AUS02210.1 AAA domain protein [Vibrio phage 2.095.B._10N.286.46.E10]